MNAFPAIAKSIVEEVALPKPKPQQGQKPAPEQVAMKPVAKATKPALKQPITPVAVTIKPVAKAAIKPSNELVLFLGSLSLSRAIVFNALVRRLAETREKVFVVSAKQWRDTLRWMWGDLNKVELVGIGSIEQGTRMEKALTEANKTVVNVNAIGLNWDKLGYERVGLDFSDRWERFTVGGCASMTPAPMPLPQSPRYALIHDDAEKGWHIRKELLPKGGLKHVRLDKSHPNLFAWRELIENATEIHCVPSAVAVLADSISTKASKLVLHSYARPNRINPGTKKNWGVLA